ncbi:MAG: PTS sugar transporter subunit IIA [Candidatus Abyssobacteria bacterium SURF_5]|uniref:PTS sugar transporter subunit IIA n=1 Tax=Abyssobacteria bacterium (strain SURF_5) TaxID=2093360 RepID=A0A3A4NZ14_ABYX5|nr:MAG: PTS sugar transporter subunit IIA [Candidatus Abyssubacteria bacterium SURF_5]
MKAEKGGDIPMRLSEFLRPELIKVRLEAKDKWDCIAQLIDLAVAAKELKPETRDKVLEIVYDRERSMSTGMERGIAIPHASTHLVDSIVGAIGISRSGIPFDSLDGQPAQLVVLLVIPKDKFQQHVRTLAGIARLFKHDFMTTALRDAKSPEEAMDIIRNEERKDLFTT